MFEKMILIGLIYKGTNKETGQPYFRANYLDLDSGEAVKDYVDSVCYNSFINNNLKFGDAVIGVFTVNSSRKLTLADIKVK